MIGVRFTHNFETAHRLFELGEGSKCWNLHGHSWVVEVLVVGPTDARGMVVEFGEFKGWFRHMIDDRLDHGAVLNGDDPLVECLRGQSSKVWLTTGDPTVEALAALIRTWVETELLPVVDNGTECHVAEVVVRETMTNAAVIR